MNNVEFIGLGLTVVAAFHLIPAITTGRIPSNWPVSPLSREAKPLEYRITFNAFALAGIIGIGLLLASAAHRLFD